MTGPYDYIIVGGGAAGCVLAARLSANPQHRVALLEAGPERSRPWFSVPGLSPFSAKDMSVNWAHSGVAEPALDARSIRLLQGKLLGGSSQINGMVYGRGHAHDYRDWQKAGGDAWGFEPILQAYRFAESNQRGASEWHGAQGPLKVRQSVPASPLVEAFLQASEQAGYRRVADLNANGVDVFGLTDVTIDRGKRRGAKAAYLDPVRARANLTVFTGAHVRRVVVDQGRAVGVEVTFADGQRTLHATHEVILAAGGLKSAHLLLLSGIGPAAQLREQGIAVVADLPGVGANLQNHPSFALRYRTTAPVSLKRLLHPLHGARALLAYGTRRGGALAEGIFNAAGFVRTSPDLVAPDAQIVMSPVLFPSANATGLGVLPRAHGLTLAVQQGQPYSRGALTLRSADPTIAPRIQTGALGDARDLPVLRAAIRIAQGIMRQPVMRDLPCVAEGNPGEQSSDVDLDARIRAQIGTAYHYCGTCAFGDAADPLAVVDPLLRVHGIAGLRVADGSVMPTIPNAPLHAPTIMIAERAAAFIVGMG